jgi:hypothetical protein
LEIPKKLNHYRFFVFALLVIAVISLTACDSATPENTPTITPNTTNDQQNTEKQQDPTLTPIVESGEDKELIEKDEVAYPDTEQENQDLTSTASNPVEPYPYPEPEIIISSQEENDSSIGDAYPDPNEEPGQEIIPTPRGNELVATDPSSIKLASGKPQLVELFAFW